MKQEYIVAVEKLMSHSGICITDALQLKKEDFDFNEKTFFVNCNKTGLIRKATIRPYDVVWFENWLKSVSGKLFPVAPRTIYHNLARYGKADLRKKLKDEMRSLGAPDSLIATKLGYFIDVNSDEKTELFVKLQEWEEKHFGGKN